MNLLHRVVWTLLVGLVVASFSFAADRFQLADLDRLVQVSEPQLTPDGKSIVVVVGRVNVAANRSDRQLVLVDVASGAQRVLVSERQSVSQPRWSPRGDQLAFLAKAGLKPQLFLLPMNGGEARQLTKTSTGVQHYAWSPDGKQIAFASADEPKKREANDDVFEIGNDGVFTTAAPTPAHIWLIDTTTFGVSPRRLTSGTWSLPQVQPPSSPSAPLSWSSDGSTIAFVKQATPHFGDNNKSHVCLVNLEGTIQPLTDRTKSEGYPIFSPGGSQLAYSAPREGDSNNVKEWHVTTPGKGPGQSATSGLDRNLVWCTWMPDSKSLLVGGHDHTRSALWHQPLDGPARRLDLGSLHPAQAFWTDAHVGTDGAMVLVGSEAQRPPELYHLASTTAKPRRLTNFNEPITQLDLGKVETITWKTDAFDADGVLVYPPGFDAAKKYPLVLWIHGGPTSASTEAFSSTPQILAAQSYIVFMPNYRGSDNLGNAYQRAIFNDAGAGPGRDVMAGLEAVKARGFIDENRIAVTGWSYGGFMTTWLIGQYHCWKTAIAGAAVTDLMDQYNLSDTNVSRQMRFGGSPWTGDYEKDYRAQSPITYARNVKTPTLILSTTGDARVPITQSYRYYHALRDNGVPVKFLAWPVSGHSPGDPYRRKDVTRQMLAWLGEHLAPTTLSPTGSGQVEGVAPAAGKAIDQKLMDQVAKGAQILPNLTYLSDIIGPRLTGTPALNTANTWTAAKMKEYGLANVRLEPWTLPEGWQRGHAQGRILEPNNGRTLALVSMAWAPGTPGKIEADVVIMEAKTVKDLEKYAGKLKGAAVLLGPPTKLRPIADIEKTDDTITPTGAPQDKRPYEEIAAFRKTLREFLQKEGAAALLQDAGKHLGLLFTTGSWGTSERPSAEQRLPTLFVAHDHYALLYRLASRSSILSPPVGEGQGGGRTRIELDVSNQFIPGPIQCFNTVGEIKGSDKPDEFVVVGAHLDSWDLGQGSLDNGGGSCVVLETARAMVASGIVPKRTIRFVLFTGEEQGLHGSKAYLKQHKDELPHTSACIVHDTGTGKVNGLGWHGRKELGPTLEKELTSLEALGVKQLMGKGFTGSDHYSFDKAGVPGCVFRQEIAGYRFGHHSQADTLEMVREPDLIQGAQVMAITAMRLANMETLLPRAGKKEGK